MTATCLVVDGGGRIPLDVERWRREPDAAEATLLAALADPVLDIGCGPGRVVGALSAAGRVALGVDSSPAAATEAARRGAPVLCRSVFEAVPGVGRWGTALLLDGNVGIGGDPVRLLDRLRTLVRPGGEVVAEVGPTGGIAAFTARVQHGPACGPRFLWATVGLDAWPAVASTAGLVPTCPLEIHGRWFGRARRP